MIFRFLLLSGLFALCRVGFADQPEGESLQTLDGLVKTWTDLRQEISTEQREWQSQKNFLEAEQRLLEKELSLLKAEMKEFEEVRDTREQQVREQVQRKEQLKKSFQDLVPMLDQMEAYLLKIHAGLPASLKAQTSFRPKSRQVDRLQSMVSALMTLENFQHGVHQTREILEDQYGDRREMEVVYLGLARGFAVSSSNDWAGVGIPDQQGWQWTSRPELSANIRELILILNQEQTAGFVDLPLELVEIGEVKP